MSEAFKELCRKLEVPPTQGNVWLIEDEFARQLSSSKARLSEAVKVLEPWASLAEVALAEAPHGAFHFQAFVDSTGNVHMIRLEDCRALIRFLADGDKE